MAHSCFRFLDGDMHYPLPALNVLVRALQRCSTRDREAFFLATVGCKRRLDRKWGETPLARVFTVADEWRALKQRSQAFFMLTLTLYPKTNPGPTRDCNLRRCSCGVRSSGGP